MLEQVVIDHGSFSCKVAKTNGIHTIPNFIVKTKDGRRQIAEEFHQISHSSSKITYPHDQGYVVNWQAQVEIWDKMFDQLNIQPRSTSLMLTEPLFNLPSIQHATNEIIFEYYEFAEALLLSTTVLTNFHAASMLAHEGVKVPLIPDCRIIVDSGHSFTHVVPILHGEIIKSHIQRIDIGGAFLTEKLQQLISFRQWNMMEEFLLVNNVKETCCYVSTDFDADLKKARNRTLKNPIVRGYILPDFNKYKRGHILDPNMDIPHDIQIITMGNERFSIPNILFATSEDLYPPPPTLPEVISRVIRSVSAFASQGDVYLETAFLASLYANIVAVGGNVLFDGMKERLEDEVRRNTDSRFAVHVYIPSNPVEFTAAGGLALFESARYNNKVVTRREYQERGESEKFDK